MELTKEMEYLFYHIRKKETTVHALGLYCFLMTLPENQRCISKKDLKSALRVSNGLLYRIIEELISLKLLDKKIRNGFTSLYIPKRLD